MPKYYELIENQYSLSTKSGSSLVASPQFRMMSSQVCSDCSFIQNLMQSVIFIAHGAELTDARRTLKRFPSPKARMDFICSFSKVTDDLTINKVFDLARNIFLNIYELRNVIAHEVWMSSEAFPDAMLFSSLENNSDLLFVSGKIWHIEEATSEETYHAMIKYIRRVKVVTLSHLALAINNCDLCNWSLMHIQNVLTEPDAQRRNEAIRAFRVFRGTSHLFDSNTSDSDPVEFSSQKSKTITK